VFRRVDDRQHAVSAVDKLSAIRAVLIVGCVSKDLDGSSVVFSCSHPDLGIAVDLVISEQFLGDLKERFSK